MRQQVLKVLCKPYIYPETQKHNSLSSRWTFSSAFFTASSTLRSAISPCIFAACHASSFLACNGRICLFDQRTSVSASGTEKLACRHEFTPILKFLTSCSTNFMVRPLRLPLCLHTGVEMPRGAVTEYPQVSCCI